MTTINTWLIASGVALAVVALTAILAYIDRNDPDIRAEWMRSQARKLDRRRDDSQ